MSRHLALPAPFDLTGLKVGASDLKVPVPDLSVPRPDGPDMPARSKVRKPSQPRDLVVPPQVTRPFRDREGVEPSRLTDPVDDEGREPFGIHTALCPHP